MSRCVLFSRRTFERWKVSLEKRDLSVDPIKIHLSFLFLKIIEKFTRWTSNSPLPFLFASRRKKKKAKLAAPFVQQQQHEQENAMRANNKKFLLSSAATATAGATASLSSSQSLSQSTDDSSTIIPNSTTMMTTQTSELVRQKSTTMPSHPSSSSSSSTHDETTSNKTRLLQRMISLRRSSSSKPSTPILSAHMSANSSASCRSYNVRAFEIARDRNLRHYPCVIHFLDDTERTFHIDVSSTAERPDDNRIFSL